MSRVTISILLSMLGMVGWMACGSSGSPAGPETIVMLPPPRLASEVSLEQVLATRRSTREYADVAIALSEISQLLWAAQGVTDDRGHRTAPSAGGLYPLDIYVAAGNVIGLDPGVYRYVPDLHQLVTHSEHDIRAALGKAALGQEWVGAAPVVFVITAVDRRTTIKYRDRGVRYVTLEAGHAAQNLVLQATALGLGAVTVGAFSDGEVAELVDLDVDARPLYILPMGHMPGATE